MAAPATTAPILVPRLPVATRLRQAAVLARRAVVGVARQPQVIVPSFLFPLIFTSINSAAFERATRLPQFPAVESFLAFLLPATVIQGALFGSISAGNDIARDVETGFFDRLVTSPVSRIAILLGRLAGGGVLAAAQACVFMAVFVPVGATLEGGILAFLVIVATASTVAMAVGGFAIALGLRTGSAEAVQGAFPLIFITLFTSSAFFPRELMTGWYRDVATYNPVSWLVEGLRHLAISGFDAGEAATALGVAAGLGTVSLTVALAQLRWRVRGAG